MGGNKDLMAGLTWRSLRQNYALMPLFACLALGTSFVLIHTYHVAAKNPEVILNKKGNPVPWDEYRDGRVYKYFAFHKFEPVEKFSGRPDL